MKIEKLFANINNNSKLVFYLFENQSRTVTIDEVEDISSANKLEILQNFEIIEQSENRISLDIRVINFIESYLDIDENIEISIISEKIKELKHKIEIATQYKGKQKELIAQLRRVLKKIDFILIQNLLKFRIRIDRVYKNIDQFSLKIKELQYIKEMLDNFTMALEEFDRFLFTYKAQLHSFYNSDLNTILNLIQNNKVGLHKSLISLTQDIIEYINRAEKKNIIIEKIAKLKELSNAYEINTATNILDLICEFDMQEKPIQIKTKLDETLLEEQQLKEIIDRISSKVIIKTKQASSIDFYDEKIEKEFVNIVALHLEFSSSNLNLIEFLLSHNRLSKKQSDEISEIYCKMILLYEKDYTIENNFIKYGDTTYKKVYNDNKTR